MTARVIVALLLGCVLLSLVACFGPIERPVADFSWCPDGASGALDYWFVSTSTVQEGCWIEDIVWEFGDDSAPAFWDGWHRFAEEDVYPVTLIVTDNRGVSGTVTKQVPIAMTAFVHPNWSLTLGWPVRVSGVVENRSEHRLDEVVVKAKFYDTDGIRMTDGTVTIEDMDPGERAAFTVDATEYSARIFYATVGVDSFAADCVDRWLYPVGDEGGE